MQTIILVLHLALAVVLVAVVLIQRSEGGGLGMGGGGGTGGLVTSRQAANFLTRLTAILAAAFIGTSLTLSILANRPQTASILDSAPLEQPEPDRPAAPGLPSVPEF